jgi:hypothetical protein
VTGGDASWLVLEPGSEVLGTEGTVVGSVAAVLGDEQVDIFHGLSIRPRAGGGDRFVPASSVTAIWLGRVQIDVPERELGRLDEITEERLPRVEGVADHVVRRLLWPER